MPACLWWLGYCKSMLEIARRPRRSKTIPLTSLIDVMFLLMKFFVLTTSYINVEALTLSMLEDAKAGKVTHSVAAEPTQELVLLSSGAAFLNNQLVYFGDLEDKLEATLMTHASSPVVILCDQGVKVQMMVDALDMVKRAGGRNVKLARWKKSDVGAGL
jgi:biopolymer transport protein ExbD